MNNPQPEPDEIRPTDPDMKWTGWALDMLRSMIEVDDRTKRTLARQQEQMRGPDAPDYALMQSRLSRSMRLSIAMTERIRIDFGTRRKKRTDSGEQERRRQKREQAAQAVVDAVTAPDEVEDVERVRSMVRETLVEDEILDMQIDSLSPEEFVREVCRKIGRPPNPDWLPRGWADAAEAMDAEPAEAAEAVADQEPTAGWPPPLDESELGRPMPEPPIPDSS